MRCTCGGSFTKEISVVVPSPGTVESATFEFESAETRPLSRLVLRVGDCSRLEATSLTMSNGGSVASETVASSARHFGEALSDTFLREPFLVLRGFLSLSGRLRLARLDWREGCG